MDVHNAAAESFRIPLRAHRVKVEPALDTVESVAPSMFHTQSSPTSAVLGEAPLRDQFLVPVEIGGVNFELILDTGSTELNVSAALSI